MALIAMWKCDRDGAMFDDKKEADAYDKMLELAEQFSALLEHQLVGVDEKSLETVGLLLAKNKELVIQACKGRPAALDEIINPAASTDSPAVALVSASK